MCSPTRRTSSSQSDLLRAVCETTGIRNAFTSFEYLRRGEHEGIEAPGTVTFVPAEHAPR